MKILFIIPGAGDLFYCGNCFRDNLLASALKKAGHDVAVMPLYLPFRHPSFQADTPLFFPATSYYVAQRFFRRRRMPKWLERLTASDAMLTMAASMSGTTSAAGTEGMTLSMITGDDPAFREQIQSLLDWIADQERPEIIHLSSTLLLGIAKELKQRLPGLPIVCSVQDEEVWIDSLQHPHAASAWQGITDNLRYIDSFVTTSVYYKNIVQTRIPGINDVEVVYPGIDKGKYDSDLSPADPTIGFFYRMSAANGLDILAEAFVKLKKKGTIPRLKLKIGGGYTGQDKRFVKKVRKILSPCLKDVEMNDTYSLDDHAAFYQSITVISVPITFEEGVGLYLCEAFAAGCPAVEPATGSFPEIIADAGIVYPTNDSDSLAEALERILTDGALLKQCRENAHALSATRYNDSVAANQLINIYTRLIY